MQIPNGMNDTIFRWMNLISFIFTWNPEIWTKYLYIQNGTHTSLVKITSIGFSTNYNNICENIPQNWSKYSHGRVLPLKFTAKFSTVNNIIDGNRIDFSPWCNRETQKNALKKYPHKWILSVAPESENGKWNNNRLNSFGFLDPVRAHTTTLCESL